LGDAIKEDERSGHVTRKRRIRYTRIWREKLKEREGDHLKALGVRENLIFQGILKEQVG
jgi:hypothetical protein